MTDKDDPWRCKQCNNQITAAERNGYFGYCKDCHKKRGNCLYLFSSVFVMLLVLASFVI